MGTSAVQDDPMLRLRYYNETGQTDEAKTYETYLRQTNQYRDPAAQPSHDFHAEYASGALAKRMAGANARDAANLQDEQASTPSIPAQIGQRTAANLANVAQGIPGMEAAQAGIRSVVRQQPYRQALGDIRSSVDQIPTAARVGERVAGSLTTMPFLPANPATAGALLGGADQALSADDMSPAERAAKTVGGATLGAVTGKLGDTAVTGVRALTATNAAKALLTRQATRAASAKQLYGSALAAGRQSLGSSAVSKFLSEPDIAPIVEEIVNSRQGAGIDPSGADMLDAVYKELSDRSGDLSKSLEVASPRSANSKKFQSGEIRLAKNQALTAAETPGPGLPMMPGYRAAAEDYATRSADIDAYRGGYDALRAQLNGMPSSKALTRTTEPAYQQWASSAQPSEVDAGAQGVLGGVKMALGRHPLTEGRRAVFAAPSLLRPSLANQQGGMALLQRYLSPALAGGNAWWQSP